MADQFEKDIARLEEIMAEMAAAAAEKDPARRRIQK